jgi:hypothetical protein
MNICEPCLTTWNQHTDPKLLCPVCRNCYGINPQLPFSELTHRIIYYNQYNAIGHVTFIVFVIGLILFIITLYLLFTNSTEAQSSNSSH